MKERTEHGSMMEPPRVLSADYLRGSGVTNIEGENLGDVKEIMVDLESGNVAYVVVSFGGILGMGRKLFAIPWSAFSMSYHDRKFILNVPKDVLKAAPGFDPETWPDMADAAWEERVRDYYKPYPRVERRETPGERHVA